MRHFNGKDLIDFEVIHKETKQSATFTASRDHLNGTYISTEGLKFPKDLYDEPVPVKGQQVGSRFSFYSLQEEIGFTNEDIYQYIKDGNKNTLDEEPELSKLLYSVNRFNSGGVQEALKEGADYSKIQQIDLDYLNEEKLNFLQQHIEQHIRQSKAELSIEEKLIEDYEKIYFPSNSKAKELVYAYVREDWEKFRELIPLRETFSSEDQKSDPRVLEKLDIVNDERIPHLARYEYKDHLEYLNDLAQFNADLAHQDSRESVRATLPAILALEDMDFEGLSDALDNKMVDKSRLNFVGISNWMTQEEGEEISLKLSENNINLANEFLERYRFDSINNSKDKRIDKEPKYDQDQQIPKDNSKDEGMDRGR